MGTGVIELQQGHVEDAEVAFRLRSAGWAQQPGTRGLAMIAQQTGRPQQAFDYYLKSLELDSNNLTALLGLFQVSCQMGTFAQVIHYLQVYLQMHPGDSSVMFCLAALYAREGQVQRARDLLRDILALEPDRQDAKDLLEEMEHKAVQINRE